MRICFLLHQGNMFSGGQGVYLAALSHEYAEMGHEVHAIVGPPYPVLDSRVVQHRVEGWSIFRLLEQGGDFWRRPAVVSRMGADQSKSKSMPKARRASKP